MENGKLELIKQFVVTRNMLMKYRKERLKGWNSCIKVGNLKHGMLNSRSPSGIVLISNMAKSFYCLSYPRRGHD